MLSHQAVRAELVKQATAQQTTTYDQLGQLFGIDIGEISQAMELFRTLDDINRAEHAVGHPLLSAVVVNQDRGLPGKGFFDLARNLHTLSGADSDAELACYIKELKEVYATTWQ